MLFQVGTSCVEVEHEIFPACNVQVWAGLEPAWYEEHNCWYGFYWEMMFDTGHIFEISQDLAAWMNEPGQFAKKPGIEDATILIFDAIDCYMDKEPSFGISTHTLEELRDELKKQVEILNRVREPV